jgi:DNA primase
MVEQGKGFHDYNPLTVKSLFQKNRKAAFKMSGYLLQRIPSERMGVILPRPLDG